MEFVAKASALMRDADLQRYVRIDNLSDWCAAIDRVSGVQGERGEIDCLWGHFRVHREMIRDGVRFTLPTCPNALQWTVTAGSRGEVVVHLTINREEQDADALDSYRQFVAEWKSGIEAGRGRPQPGKVAGHCAPCYG